MCESVRLLRNCRSPQIPSTPHTLNIWHLSISMKPHITTSHAWRGLAKAKANPSKPYLPTVSTHKPSKLLFQTPSSLTKPTLSSSSPVTPYTLTFPPLSFPTSLNSDISHALPSTSSKPITPIQSHSTLSFLGSPGFANPDPFSSSLTL